MMLKETKTENKAMKENQQMLGLLLKETEGELGNWREADYKKEVTKTRSLFKAMRKSF